MKININKHLHDTIPVIEYIPKNPKRLLFINHGIYGTKEKLIHLLGMPLAKIGYHVVALDAYKHGSRGAEPFISKDTHLAHLLMFDVVKVTANDIVRLYEDNYLSDYASFDVLGLSMGGYTAYYLTLLTDHIDTVVTLISSPNFSAAATLGLPEKLKDTHKNETERVRKTVQTMDPSLHAYEMKMKKIIAFNGDNDDVVPNTHTTEFFKNNPNIEHRHAVFETGHKINRTMSESLIKELKKTG